MKKWNRPPTGRTENLRQVWEFIAKENDGYYEPKLSLPRWLNGRLRKRIVTWCRDLPRGSRILDMACGRGDLGRQLLKNRPDMVVVSMDFSWTMVNLARGRKNDPPGNSVQGVVDRVPFRDRTFDVVILLNILNNLSDQGEAQAAVREACRVSRGWVLADLRPPGLLSFELRVNHLLSKLSTGRTLARMVRGGRDFPAGARPFSFFGHQAADLFRGLKEVGRLHPWPLAPSPSRIHVLKSRII